MYKIAKIIDQWGWAYHFLDREQQKYSKHNLTIQKYNDINLDGLDAIYIHGPDISPETKMLSLEAKERGIKVIGGHAGPIVNMSVFPYLDLAVGISPETFGFASDNYSCPKVFLPEGIDTNFFTPKKRSWNSFLNWGKKPNEIVVGWAGRNNGFGCKVKRTHLLSNLDFPVRMQCSHDASSMVKERTLKPMLSFYNSIDVLVLTSLSECMPRVILESCACGIPVISTDVGSIKMMIHKDWIVPVNPEELVVKEMNKKLHQLKDRNLRMKVGYDNMKRVKKLLSWNVIAPFWDTVFSAVIEENYTVIDKINKHFGVI
jgi:glycosyltransferase involved in cell wall biosynthesis